jgi:hypothetical protein
MAETSDYRKRAERAIAAEEGVGRIATAMEEMDVALQDYEMVERANDTSRTMEEGNERAMEEKGSRWRRSSTTPVCRTRPVHPLSRLAPRAETNQETV